jgi:hypothetical protein
VATGAFALTASVHLIQTGLDIFRHRRYFSIVLFLGGALEAFAWAMRVIASNDVLASNPYIIQLAVLVVAPVFLSAAIYAFFGYLIAATGDEVLPRRFKAKRVSLTYLVVDFVTLLVQVMGGVLASSKDPVSQPPLCWATRSSIQATGLNGTNLMLGGIAAQLATMVVFAAVFVWFFTKTDTWAGLSLGGPNARFTWLLVGTAVCSVLVITRGIYRTVELADGFNGSIAHNQSLLIFFDALLMLLVLLIFK